MKGLKDQRGLIHEVVADEGDMFPVAPPMAWVDWSGTWLIRSHEGGAGFDAVKVVDDYTPSGNDFLQVDEDGALVNHPDAIVDAGVVRLKTAADLLTEAQSRLKAAIKVEGLARIGAVFPAISDFDQLQLVREQWLSIAPAARNATADFQQLIDIYQAGTAAVTSVDALDQAGVDTYDVVNDPAWPA